jgi:hypothetical protein
MLNEIQMAFASITGAKNIAEGLIAARDTGKIAEATASLLARLIEVQSAVLAIQSEQASLQDELARTKKEKLELEEKLAQRVSGAEQFVGYEFAEIAYGNVHAYAQKPDEKGFRKAPYLCATCHSEGKYSVLNFQKATDKQPSRLVCPAVASHALALPRGAWTAQNLGNPASQS